MKAIVYPVITGTDFSEPAAPIAISADSKEAAIAALQERGYRIMSEQEGGYHTADTITADALRGTRGNDADVMSAARDIGYALADDAEITQYSITVHA